MQLTHTLNHDEPPPPRRLVGLAAVVAFHLLLVYALVSGLARNVVEVIKKPLETKLVVELPPLPPPRRHRRRRRSSSRRRPSRRPRRRPSCRRPKWRPRPARHRSSP